MSIELDRNILKKCVQRNLKSNASQSFLNQNRFDDIKPKNDNMIPEVTLLKKIANDLNVPIIIASCRNERNIMCYHSFGIDARSDFCRLAHASHQFCSNGMRILPDITKCEGINKIYGNRSTDIARFYVGVPIRNAHHEIIGSMAVLQESRLIAQNAFSLRQLREIGQDFAAQISAWPMTQVGYKTSAKVKSRFSTADSDPVNPFITYLPLRAGQKTNLL